jgi:hypothetical protein
LLLINNMPSEKQLKYWESLKGKPGYWLGKKRPDLILPQRFTKGQEAWNKGISQSEEIKNKISETNKNKGIEPRIRFVAVSENHPQWKGDSVSYSGLHYWVSRKLGKPKECEHCGDTKAKKFEWANKNGMYLRELTDWIRLCVSCHRKYDGHAYKSWQTRSVNYA